MTNKVAISIDLIPKNIKTINNPKTAADPTQISKNMK